MIRAALALACTILGASCFGRSVVGEVALGEPPSGVCEEDELTCLDFGDAPEFPEIDPLRFAPPAPCSDTLVEMRLGEETSAPDALPIEVADLDASCGTLRLTLARGAREVALLAPRLGDGRLEIAAEGTSTVTITGATGDGAYLVLEGSSSLRLRSLDGVAGWRVDAASDGRGWDVEVDGSELHDAALRTAADTTLLVRQSRLVDATIEAGSLSLQGATLEGAQLDARELITSGTDVHDGEVRARLGSLGSGTVEGTRLHGCDSFLVRETALERSDFGACAAAPLQIESATISRSIVRGRLFAVQTHFVESILGRELGSSISLVDSRVAYSLLCDVEAISARGGSVLTCARCAPDSPRAACIDEASFVTVVACPTIALAEVCVADLPPSLTAPDAGMP